MELISGPPWRVLASSRPWRAVLWLVISTVMGAVTLVMIAGLAGLTVLFGLPLAGLPAGAFERRRTAILGQPALIDPHRPPRRTGLRSWLSTRYGEAATWRELAYAVLLALILGPISGGLLMGLGSTVFAMIAVPRANGGGAYWTADIGFVVLFLVALYVATAFVAGHARLARGLVGGEAEAAVHDLTSSRARLVDAFEVERRRIERDLHDGAQQELVALAITLGLLDLELRDGPHRARDRARRAGAEARAALAALRDLIRGIHPQVLTDHGLAAAVAELADRSPLRVTVDLPAERLPAPVESAAYFVTAEALTNAVKHASATVVAVTGRVYGGSLVVEITDDGLGGADPSTGTGLAGLGDRIVALSGTLHLTSPLGGPTVLRLEVPCSG
jgi:signal transduction histidine kinase